jgi:hypothetical protein
MWRLMIVPGVICQEENKAVRSPEVRVCRIGRFDVVTIRMDKGADGSKIWARLLACWLQAAATV